MQLYLGYGGAWVLSPPEFLQPKKIKESRHYFTGRTGQTQKRKRKK